jgi:hypothetical protein
LFSDKLGQRNNVSQIKEPNLTEHSNYPVTLRNETEILISDDADQAQTHGYEPMFSPKEPSFGTPRIPLETSASPTLKKNQRHSRTATPKSTYQTAVPRNLQTRAMRKRFLTDDAAQGREDVSSGDKGI